MPMFNQMTEAYGDNTALLHMVWVSEDGAPDWGEQLDAKGPVLPDPEGAVVRAYEKVYSVVAVEVGADGRIADSYRGYGREEMERLNQAMARAAGVPPAPVDLSSAPEKQTYG